MTPNDPHAPLEIIRENNPRRIIRYNHAPLDGRGMEESPGRRRKIGASRYSPTRIRRVAQRRNKEGARDKRAQPVRPALS